MSDITAPTPRYGYDPKVMFAATRATAERRRQEAATVTAETRAANYLRRLIGRR